MKTRAPHNNFDEHTRFIFLDDNYWTCWRCGRNHANCGHHIFGRGNEEGCEKSPFNFAPLNNHMCHLPYHGWLMSEAGRKQMFQKTLDYLSSIGYTLTELDNQFLEKYGLQIYHLGIKL